LYVLALNREENALIVGGQDELGQSTCRIADCHYISGTPPRRPRQILAQIRYRADPEPAVFSPLRDHQGLVEFAGRQSGVTPGQFLVLYDDARVIGGGVICQSKEA
jgi:tRNA-specific 2-thiouridylase